MWAERPAHACARCISVDDPQRTVRPVTKGQPGRFNKLGPKGGAAVAGALTALTGLKRLTMR